MKKAEIQTMGIEELTTSLKKVTENLTKLKFQKAVGKLEKSHELTGAKKTKARIKTRLKDLQSAS